MIALVYGTTAELIKLAPLHVRLAALGSPPLHWCTAQQADELPEAIEHLDMPQPDLWLARGAGGRSLQRSTDVLRWLSTVAVTCARRYRSMRSALRADGRPPLVLVHGDTMTTVVGAALGRVLGATVGHVEAGLRSHDWRNPFPEELDRVIAARLARVHFAPGEREAQNLASAKGEVVVTRGNTVIDALLMVPADADPAIDGLPSTYGLVSLHRAELLQQRDLFEASLRTLREAGARTPLVMVVDALTAGYLARYGLEDLFDGGALRRVEKLPYHRFAALVRGARFIVTDSGGLQEESAAIGVPCLVHRSRTERYDGLGANVLLSDLDLEVMRRFLESPDNYRVDVPPRADAPSDLIVDHLVRRGFVHRRDSNGS